MNFKEYLGERVYRLTSNEQEGVNKVVDRYFELLDPKNVGMPMAKILMMGPEKVFKNLIKDGVINLGSINYFDQEDKKNKSVPVMVGFDRKPKDKGTFLRKDGKDSIILHYYKMVNDRAFIEDALVHELYHAKQPYKLPGSGYSEDRLSYYLDPVEVHTYISNIIKVLEENANKEGFKDFLLRFIKEGNLPNHPLSSIIKKIGKDEFVQYLYDNRLDPRVKVEYRRLINKLIWLYNTLDSK